MIRLWNIVSRFEYQSGVEAGLIKAQKHPYLPLHIHNYTAAATYTKGAWDNRAVRRCRGIITDSDDKVIARPFEKFFNHNQPEVGPLRLKADCIAYDKMDGSLGILYPTDATRLSAGLSFPEYAIATRGSFTSEQAIHATKVWKEKYADRWNPQPGYTYLFEIVYPENRIVVDYGDMDDLVLLGYVFNNTGVFFGANENSDVGNWWPGPRAKTLPYKTVEEALEAEPRPNAEGLVLKVLNPTRLVKIKQEDYLILHKLITGLRPRSIWEFLAVNACKHLIEKPKHWESRIGLFADRAQEILDMGDDWKTKYLEKVPDEFIQWLDDTIEELEHAVHELGVQLRKDAAAFKESSPDRRSYFASIKKEEHFGLLGLLYDDKDITTGLWKAVYPNEGSPFKSQPEEVA